MSYHECPIEPDDWANGNGEEGDCRECEGTGECVNDRDEEYPSPACGGSGFVDREPLEDDYL
jgi:hypothetical protein